MARLGANLLRQGFRARQGQAILSDELAYRFAQTQASCTASQGSEIYSSACFVPRAKLAHRCVVPHRFARATQAGELPVVDNPRPLRSDMRNPTSFDKPTHQRPAAVLYKVRTVGQHHRRPALPSVNDAISQRRNLPSQPGVFHRGRLG